MDNVKIGLHNQFVYSTLTGILRLPKYHSMEKAMNERAIELLKVFELEDKRHALERVLLHFSHLEKETKRLDETHYRVTLRYDPADETEMVIRILSFGPVIRVLEPARFIGRLRERIERQRDSIPATVQSPEY